ncbi:hypothetical protein B2H94_03125 [Clostridium sporogenes]|jgi:ABC-type polysaccharide/polyol phosphate export permease|uniref:Uncharacterized protein n=2 Tax=Clostridium TaxID=1485 RepID=A0AAE5C7S9_CLOSG|nr:MULTISPECIES: hypothetical protein [Clostridium]MBE6076874.1 hypothetical protein [Clostridium lundense]MDU2833507.1 hypothetical protein [Clostridium botulinum]EDU38843.1 hypothetical protein CLOSPO_01705 [Clostridium sporogenes ATCC 15579]KIS22979.1 membrane protein [Clostridium botulinum B2 450]MCW6093262.1 hypothetical protein [Clostridium sporogenes]
MGKKPSVKRSATLLAIVSLIVSIIVILPILNWLFKITPWQKWEGLPLFFGIFISPLGFLLGILSVRIETNKWGKLGIVINTLLFLLPFIYMTLGVLIFGP